MTNRSCVPVPMIPTPSEASMAKEILRPSTAVTVAVAVMVAPIGQYLQYLRHRLIQVARLLVQLLP